MNSIQQTPGYHAGFYDAQEGVPLWFGECTDEYEAGWLAFWDLYAILVNAS